MAQKGKDPYQLVTERIVKMLDKGIIPWQKPWSGGMDGAISYSTGKPYSLINQFLLGRAGEYLTWKQITELGGSVKKGSKSNFVVFFKMARIADGVILDNEEENEEAKIVPVLRYYTVFHIDDCEGIESKVKKAPKKVLSPIADAEKVVEGYYGREACRLNIKLSDRAFYSLRDDSVTVPEMKQYQEVEEYYSTLFHETIHSTGHPKRLNRELGIGFGSEPYSKEELVAEIGAAFLCNHCGLDSEKAFKNSVGYIQNWSKRLKEDKRLIIAAAGKAEKAAKYILSGPRPIPV